MLYFAAIRAKSAADGKQGNGGENAESGKTIGRVNLARQVEGMKIRFQSTPMELAIAEIEINKRLLLWIQAVAKREVAEDFPILRACQHNRRVMCFLAWMHDLKLDRRIPVCLSLANPTEFLAREERNYAIATYHDRLPPTPDTDRALPGFLAANSKTCRDLIIQKLEPTLGRPRRCHLQKLWYTKQFGDWIFITHVEIRRLLGPTVDCYHFLRRSDRKDRTLSEFRFSAEDLKTNLDPLKLLGVSWSQFPLIGKSHEQLCSDSVQTVTELLLSALPQIVAGLGVYE